MTKYLPLDAVETYRRENPPNPTEAPLQLLYPGRHMPAPEGMGQTIDRYDYPHEHPVEARESFERTRKDIETYAGWLENRARRDGGKDQDKVTSHAVEDPSLLVDDPDLKFATVQQPPTWGDGSDDPERKTDATTAPPDVSGRNVAPRKELRENFGTTVGSNLDKLVVIIIGVVVLFILAKSS